MVFYYPAIMLSLGYCENSYSLRSTSSVRDDKNKKIPVRFQNEFSRNLTRILKLCSVNVPRNDC